MTKAKITINGSEISIEGSGKLTREDIKDYNVSEIEKIVIEDDCTEIGDYVFSNAYTSSSLASLTISNSVLTIGRDAFSHSYNLTNIDIPNVKNIGDYAFDFCGELTTVTIGDAIESIGSRCFLGCKKLASVTINASTPPALRRDDATHLSLVFEDTALGENSIHVPQGRVDAYRSSWAEYKDFITDGGGGEVIVNSVTIDDTCPRNVVKGTNSTTLTATVSVTPDDSSYKGVAWSSSDPSIASIGETTGTISASTNVGSSCTITATSVKDSSKKDTCEITIIDDFIYVTSVSFSDCPKNINVNEQITLTPTVEPDNATNKRLKWESSNTDIATVDSNGNVSGVSASTNPITITAVAIDRNEISGDCQVIVTSAPTNLKFEANYSGGEIYQVSCNESKILTRETTLNTDAPTSSSMLNAIIGDCVELLDTNAFDSSDGEFANLSSVTFSENSSLTGISSQNFYYVRDLRSFKVPKKVKQIGDRCFENCQSLTSLTFENGCQLETVGYAFGYGCYYLRNVTMPNEFKSAGVNFLANCTHLTSVTFTTTTEVPRLGDDAFNGSPLEAIYVPCESLEAYKTAYGSRFQYPIKPTPPCYEPILVYTATYNDNSEYKANGCSSDDQIHGFCSCSNPKYVCNGHLESRTINVNNKKGEIKTVLLSGNEEYKVTNVVSEGFKNCVSLEQLDASDLVSISSSMCEGCTNLTKFHLGMRVKDIGTNAFYGCTSLTSVTYDDNSSIDTINGFAFNECTSLTKFGLDDSNESFSGVDIKVIGERAFRQSGIKKIKIGTEDSTYSKFKGIDLFAFAGCISLTNVEILYKQGDATGYYVGGFLIDDCAFSGCTALETVTLGEGVKGIEQRAFNTCTSLKSVTIKATTPPTLGIDVFSGVSSEFKIYVPSKRVDTYKTATNWSSYSGVIEEIPTS